jgi:hypothetical protein
MTSTRPANPAPVHPEDDPDRALWVRTREEYGRALTQARAICPQGATDAILHQCARGLLEHFQAIRALKLALTRQKARGGAQPARQASTPAIPVPFCPQCRGDMYDNRKDKTSKGAPDFRCKKKSCLDAQGRMMAGWVDPKQEGGVRWAKMRGPEPGDGGDDSTFPEGYDDDELPF